jgi:TDG/mug DNA glycosylase family protein
VPDVVRSGLVVVVCGINPGLYSAAIGHHFARPGNRFWKALHCGGWTDRVLDAREDQSLPLFGIGLTNLVDRATASAAELDRDELVAGREALEAKTARFRPHAVAILGVTAYRVAFGHRRAELGLQALSIGTSAVWVLPNPSGLNAHYQLSDLAAGFRAMHEALAA